MADSGRTEVKMSTNFYAKSENQDWFDGPLHLGQSAGPGVQFMLHLDRRYYQDWPSMKEWLADAEIRDEYGELFDLEEFIEWVEYRQEGRTRGDLHIDGYAFDDGEFS